MAHVECIIKRDENSASLTWSEGPASFQPYVLEGRAFEDAQEKAAELRHKLETLVRQHLMKADEAEPTAAPPAYELACAGFELYERLFNPGVDAGKDRGYAQEVRAWLEGLRDQKSIDTLELVDDTPGTVPWNVIYDKKPKRSQRTQFVPGDPNAEVWKPFWGIRYNLAGTTSKVDPRSRNPRLQSPVVLMVVDQAVRDELPEREQQKLSDFCKSRNLDVVSTKDELLDYLDEQSPTLLYWMSHAGPSRLELGDEVIDPNELIDLLEGHRNNPFGGIAFLNGCQTAGFVGENNCSFVKELKRLGFSGMVGTEHVTINTLANPIGLGFLQSFLQGGEPIGKILRRLRRQHVPLGLLYGAYCPPEIHVAIDVPEGDSVVSSVGNVTTTPNHGAVLSAATATPEKTSLPLPDEPYPSLDYYTRQDRALFAGRDDDIERFASLLDRTDCRIMVLHGESGVGKSSFLRAGVIPYLEEDCKGYRFLDDHPHEPGNDSDDHEAALFIRATNDLVGQLAEGLCTFCEHSYRYRTPRQAWVDVDLANIVSETIGRPMSLTALDQALRADPSLFSRLLTGISAPLPFTLVVVVDQCEEVFTLAESSEDAENSRLGLSMLRRTIDAEGDFKVILSLRTEYYGRLVDRLRRGLRSTEGIREYLLTDFDQPALLKAMQRPTSKEPVRYSRRYKAARPFKKYGFQFAEGVLEKIASGVLRYSTEKRDSVLPLVQVICSQLYERVRHREDKTIFASDLAATGDIEGGMRKHVERLMANIEPTPHGTPVDQDPFKLLLTKLFHRQADGSVTTALVSETKLSQQWTGTMPFSDVLREACEVRLLRVSTKRIGDLDERRVSLGHDSVAKLSAQWEEEISRAQREREARRKTRVRTVIAVGMGGLALLASMSAVFAIKQREQAVKNFNLANDSVESFYTRIGSEALLNQPGMQDLRKDLLTKARNYYVDFLGKQENTRQMQSQVALAHFHVGGISEMLDEHGAGIKDFQAALAIQDKLVKQAPSDKQLRRQRSDTRNAVGKVHQLLKDYEKAEKYYEAARSDRQLLVDASPWNPEFQRLLASTYNNLGQLERVRRTPAQDDAKLTKAKELIAKANTIRKDTLAELESRSNADPTQIEKLRRDLGIGLLNQGVVLTLLEQPVTTVLEDVLCELEALPDSFESRHNQAKALWILGDKRRVLSEFEEADRRFLQAEELLLGLTRDNPAVPEYKIDLTAVYELHLQSLYMQAESEFGVNKLDAINTLRRRLPILSSLTESDQDGGFTIDLGESLLELAQIYENMKDAAPQTLEAYAEAAGVFRDLLQSQNGDFSPTARMDFAESLKFAASKLVDAGRTEWMPALNLARNILAEPETQPE